LRKEQLKKVTDYEPYTVGYHKFGFAPSSIAGVALLFVVFLLLTGQL